MIHRTDVLVDKVNINDVVIFDYNNKSRCGVVVEKGDYGFKLWDFTVKDKLDPHEYGGYRNYLYSKISNQTVTSVEFDGLAAPVEFLVVDERLSSKPAKVSLLRRIFNWFFFKGMP
jgi:hypothetical protein